MAQGESYEEFVEKFKPKKTTDDCYTPPAVYEAVLGWVRENCDIEGLEIKRPFYPNGNYQAENYDENCVVIDNPPFSIISQIIRFYNEKGVKYFLFAPYITLFSTNQDYTAVVCDYTVTYENGAKVNTSFVSNLFGDIKILGCPDLFQRVKEANLKTFGKPKPLKVKYPKNVVTSRRIGALVIKGERIKIMKEDLLHCCYIDAQKPLKTKIYGYGFLCSDKVADYLLEKEKNKEDETIFLNYLKENANL